MEGFLFQFLNVSIQVGIVIGIVLLARLVFRLAKVPKRYSYILWAIPFLRLVFPWQIESPFSMLPKGAASAGSSIAQNATAYMKGTADTNMTMEPGQEIVAAGSADGSGTIVQIGMILAFAVWLTVVLLLVVYGALSYWKLKRSLVCSVRMKENIYLADAAKTPFVMGVFSPRIYLPSDIQEHELEYVIAHERTHIQRRDHIIKMGAYFVACIYWFHPLVWIAYLGLGKDMEMSCDEAVMNRFGEGCRSEYASVLLALTTGRKRLAGVPLAFGEGDTRMRITNIMKYKKPVVLVAVVATLALVILAVGLLTNPDSKDDFTGGKEDLLIVAETETEMEIEMEAETETEQETETGLADTKKEGETREPAEEVRQPYAEKGEEVQQPDAGSGEEVQQPDTEERIDEPQTPKNEEDAKSNLYGMEIVEGTLTASGLTVHIWNTSDKEFSYGSDFHLKYLDGEEWKDVPYIIDNWGFTSEARIPDPDGTDEKISWEWLYGKLEPGTYMLTKGALIRGNSNSEDPYEPVNLGVKFTLK